MIGGSFQSFHDRGNSLLIIEPALNIGVAPCRVGGDGDPGGMRSVRPTDDSSVPCRDSLATRELAPSSFGLGCTLWLFPFLPLPFLFLSFFVLLYFFLLPIVHANEIASAAFARVRRFAPVSAEVFRSRSRVCYDFGNLEDQQPRTQDSIFAIAVGDRCQTGLNRYEMIVHVILQRINSHESKWIYALLLSLVVWYFSI